MVIPINDTELFLQKAKAFGIHTGETVWQAKQKCPELILVPVHFERYKKYSKLVRDIYYEYTNFVEPYGLDEAYLNISKPDGDFNYALETARKIKKPLHLQGLQVSWRRRRDSNPRHRGFR